MGPASMHHAKEGRTTERIAEDTRLDRQRMREETVGMI